MALLAIDLGGTKLSTAVFTTEGLMITKQTVPLQGRAGSAVGKLITETITETMSAAADLGDPVQSIGICVPGISRMKKGTVWAPNIPGWEDYPLLEEVKKVTGATPVIVDSDRSCYIMGEVWKGNAKGSSNAIFLAVGTGIGAGIIIDGNILRGAQDIGGAVGWLALERPYQEKYKNHGCFEYAASGNGIARIAEEMLQSDRSYSGILRQKPSELITAHDVFSAAAENDLLALAVLRFCIEYWGMAIANLVSTFNPEKIIIGGGIFGPALQFLPQIKQEALKWAQPISWQQVSIEPSALGSDAGIYGAAYMALQNQKRT